MNSSLLVPPSTDPAQLLRYRDRQYAAELLALALIHLDLFSWLEQNPGQTLASVCSHFGFAQRPVDVLLTLLRSNGLLETRPDGALVPTPLAREHLMSQSPWFLGPYYAPIQDTPIVRDFLKVLKTGKPANWQAKEEGGDWHASMLSEDFARHFTALMNSRGLALGQVLAQKLTPYLGNRQRVLDVGAGSGVYSSTLLAVHPNLTATLLEQAPVDAIAREEVKRHGLESRIQVVAGDMFRDPWPEGHNILLLSNVLHDWDFPEVKILIQHSFNALPVGGLLVIHEAFLKDDKTGPLPVAEYSALLMCITQGKCYTAGEYGEILKDTGFEVGSYVDTLADRGFITAIKRG